MTYVFRTPVPRPTGDPNGAGLPHWPAFAEPAQQVLHIDGTTRAEPVPNLTQLRALDDYFGWRRQQAHAHVADTGK
jgi:para-nitrobenzyl esterase